MDATTAAAGMKAYETLQSLIRGLRAEALELRLALATIGSAAGQAAGNDARTMASCLVSIERAAARALGEPEDA